jgi:NADPH:quinone reductase-like Zn-dependent oxidoreductase
MRAIGVTEWGGPEKLRVVEVPEPEPGPGEVRIRVHYATVNATDTWFITGWRTGLDAPESLRVPGMDAAGVIDAVGPDNDGRLAVGDEVIALVLAGGPHGGAYADQVVVASTSVVRAPKGIELAAASTLLMNAMTARCVLDTLAPAGPSEVAINGAAGCLGGYLIQLAKDDGLSVIADAKPGDEDTVRGFGADEVVARGDDLAAHIRAIRPAGVPALADAAVQDARVLPAVSDNGQIGAVRQWEGGTERGITVHTIWVSAGAEDTKALERLRDQAEDGTLTLRVADVIPAEQAAEAHRRLALGGIRGRLVLDFTV